MLLSLSSGEKTMEIENVKRKRTPQVPKQNDANSFPQVHIAHENDNIHRVYINIYGMRKRKRKAITLVTATFHTFCARLNCIYHNVRNARVNHTIQHTASSILDG